MAYRVHSKYRYHMARPGGCYVNEDIEAILCMAGNNCLTTNPATVAGFTLNECDGANYARKDVYFDIVESGMDVFAVSKTADLLTAVDQLNWASLGAGAGNNVGVLFATKSTHDIPGIPIMYVELDVPGNGNGEDFKADLDSEGVYDIANGGV